MATLRTSFSLQGRRKDQDSEVATKYTCAECLITYYATQAHCPLCDSNARLKHTQDALRQIQREIEFLTNANKNLAEAVDSTRAVRNALDLLDDPDRAFLKGVLYQWKADRGVNLRVTHTSATTRKGRVKGTKPNGFVAIFRGSDPVAHVCSSMGGVAIAEYYEEALRTVGHEKALNMLLKGFNELLPGAIDGVR